MNQDGSITGTFGKTAYMPVNGVYVDHKTTESPSLITIESKNTGSLIFDKSACTLSIYEPGFFSAGLSPVLLGMKYEVEQARPLPNKADQIWTPVPQNNLSCTTTFQDGANGFTLIYSQKNPTGEIETKYVKQNGVLESFVTYRNTNPSNISNVFGFVETFTPQRNLTVDRTDIPLANANAVRIGKAVMTENILSMTLNGKEFIHDFDKASGLLTDVAYDPVSRSASINYRDASSVILPNNQIVLDPVFGFTAGTIKRVYGTADVSTVCGTGQSFSTAAVMYYGASTANDRCTINSYEWDITSIDDTATITDTVFQWTGTAGSNPKNCDWTSIEVQPSTQTAAALYEDIKDGTVFVSNDTTCKSSTGSLDLGASADADVEANLASDWWGLGTMGNPHSRDSSAHSNKFGTVEIQITYTTGGSTANVTDELGLDDSVSITQSHTVSVTDELGLDDSVGIVIGGGVSVTDELGLDDSVGIITGGSTNVTDDLGLDDSVEIVSNGSVNITDDLGLDDSVGIITGGSTNVTDELGLDDSVLIQVLGDINVTDELGLDDSVGIQLSGTYVTDELGLDDSVSIDVVQTIYNAIKLFLAPPTSTRLGGIFAESCTPGEYVTGIDTAGHIICAP